MISGAVGGTAASAEEARGASRLRLLSQRGRGGWGWSLMHALGRQVAMHALALDDRGFLQALAGDGRPALRLLALGLILSGLFALYLALTGQFLPHDERFLGMSAEQLCAL